MNKKIIWFVFLIVLIVGSVSFLRNNSKQSNTLTLGLMLPLSGDFSVAGENYRKGAILALDQYKKSHPDTIINMVVEDDAFDVKKGLSAYKKLTSIDKIDALMMASTPVIDAIYKDVIKTDIPVIQLGVQTVGVAKDNIFQFSPAAEAPIGYLAEYLDTDISFGGKKVAVLYDNAPGPISFFAAFKKRYTHDFTPFIVNSKDDIRGYATKIANENYDAVIFIQSPLSGALAAKEIITLDKTVPILVFDAQLQSGFGEYKKVLGDINKINGAKSMWFKSGKREGFDSAFKEKYNEEPGFITDFGYDILLTLLEKYDGDNKKWQDNIQNTNNPDGVSGSISFDSNGVRIQPMVITQVKNGELVPIGDVK